MEALLKLAEQEQWKDVNAVLLEGVEDEHFTWATKTGLYSADGDERHLAARIMEQAQDLTGDSTNAIVRLDAMTTTEPNYHAKFYAACACAKNGRGTNAVRQIIEKGLEEPSVCTVAQKYMTQLA